MMKNNIDEMLGKAFVKEYFGDGSAERGWNAARRKSRQRSKPKWVPAAVCAAVAVTVLAAVPQVRAAVGDFFASVGAYMAAPAEERPEIEGVNVQQVHAEEPVVEVDPLIKDPTHIDPEAATAAGAAPLAENWEEQIGVEIKEALYDGETLHLTFTIDGSKVGLITSAEIFEKTGGMPTGEDAYKPIYTNANVLVDGGDGTKFPGYDHSVKTENGVVTVTSEFSDKGAYNENGTAGTLKGFSGAQKMCLKLSIAEGVAEPVRVGDEIYSGSFNHNAAIRMPFTLNADNGMIVKDGDTYMVDGLQLIFTSVHIKPTELSIDVLAPVSAERKAYREAEAALNEKWREIPEDQAGEAQAEFDALYEANDITDLPEELGDYLGFKAYLDGEPLKGGINDVGDYLDFYQETQAGDAYMGRLVIPFPAKDAKELSLLPYNRLTGEEYPSDEIAIPLR